MSTTTATTPSNIATPTSDLLKVDNTKTTNKELDKDAFINLLVTQMKYQDPLNPMDNQEMMAQMAQFSALEQMMNVAQAVEKQAAHAMIGKQVQYQYTDDTGTLQSAIGKIDYVKIENGSPLFGIGENEVTSADIQAVIDSANIQSNTSAFELLGKTVQGTMKVKNTQGIEEAVIIEGEISSINMKDSEPYLVIGTGSKKVELAFTDIQNIVEKPTVTGRVVTATVTDANGNKEAVEGVAEYIYINKEGTYVYVNGQMVDFDDIESVKNK